MSLTYAGAAGHDLLRVTPLLNPNPNFSFIDVTSNTAGSNYQGLQVIAKPNIDRASSDFEIRHAFTVSPMRCRHRDGASWAAPHLAVGQLTVLRGFGAWRADVAMQRQFALTQALVGSLGSGGANGGLSPLYQIGGPRSAQLALRLIF